VPPGATSAAGPLPSRRLFFRGEAGTLFGIQIVNALLTLVTLGIFYFWGKARVRRYLLSQTLFEGDRFAYHGTGKELLLGWLKALLVFGVPVFSLTLLGELAGSTAVAAGANLLAYAIVLVFVPVAVVGARRYRLSRTSWRAIRFSFRGRGADFVRLFVVGSLLSVVTLSLYIPVFATRRQDFLVSHSYFGNERFRFDGRGRDLLRPYLLVLLLTLPTLGLCWFWFVARKRRYFWDHTTFATTRFRSTVSGGSLLALVLGNALLLVVTLGLGWPWVRVRNARFACRYLTLVGPLNVAAIEQDAQSASPIGEGLAGFFDSGFDFG
jgi:uncharacterized membrane protein YjgN (DUF898 family)